MVLEKEEIKMPHKGYKQTLEVRQKHKNQIPWNKGKKGLQISWCKGLTKDTDSRVRKRSEAIVGKEKTLEHRLNLSKSRKRYLASTQKEDRDFLINDIKIYYFCGDLIIKRGLSGGCLAVHSLDGNHENWLPENKVSVHKKCHNNYHNKLKAKNPSYCRKLSLALTGRKFSPETIIRMSISQRKRQERERVERNMILGD